MAAKRTKNEIENIEDLRDGLIAELSTFKKSKAEPKDVAKLSAITQCSSAIIRSTKVELDYKKHMEDDGGIKFLEVGRRAAVKKKTKVIIRKPAVKKPASFKKKKK